MQNEASKTRSLDIAFVVDADQLRRLEVMLSEVSDLLEYTVRFSDGTRVRYNSVEDVIGLPNSKTHCIVSITAGATGKPRQSAYVVLRDNPSPSVEYTVSGTQHNVIYFAQQLDDWTAALREWYSFFYSPNVAIVTGIILLFAPFFLLDTGYRHVFPELASKGKPDAWVALPLLAILYFVEFWLVRLFPRGTFAVGSGAKRHQLFAFLRYGVFGAFAISVLASVLGNWISRHF